MGRSGAHTQVGQRTLDAASRTCCLSSLSHMLLQCIVRKHSGKPSRALGLLSKARATQTISLAFTLLPALVFLH